MGHTEVLPQNDEIGKGDDGTQFRGVGSTALLVERVMLNEVDVDELVKGSGDVLGPVEGCYEGVAGVEKEGVSCVADRSSWTQDAGCQTECGRHTRYSAGTLRWQVGTGNRMLRLGIATV